MDKNAIRNILTIMIVVFLGLPVSAEVLGTYTTNEYFYLPAYGEFGEDAFDEYNLYMQIADTQIEANKNNSFATIDTEAELEAAISDITDIYTNNDFDIADYALTTDLSGFITDLSTFDTDDLTEGLLNLYFPGFTSLFDDYAFTDNSSDWDTAYGWGNHSTQGYLKNITNENFASLKDIPAHPATANKILETTADGYQYIDTPSGGAGGETNTASNIGGQIEIFKQKEGVDLEFRTLRAGTGIDIYNSVPTGTWDITNCSYDTISKSVSLQDSTPRGVAFSSDGSKMYIAGDGSDTVYQYTLSTAWNIGTASYDSISKSVSSQDSYPFAVAFNSDGSKMYILGYINKTVYQYTLSTPWNVGTATYDSVSVSVNSQESTPYGVAFNSDGSKMYIVGSSNDTVYQYTLSTPWNVGTATYDSISKNVSSQESSPRAVAFSSDGTKMYIAGDGSDTVYQYTLSTAWNVSTASYDSVSFSVSSQESYPFDVAFNSDGTKMYIVGYTNKTVFQYTVGGTTEYDYVQIDLDFKYDPSIASGEYSGIPDTGIVGETVIFGDLLYFKWSDKKYWKARANSAATAEVVAMAVEAKSANNSCVIIRQGYVRNDSWSAFTDSIVYLSTATAGKMQSSVPDSSGDQIKRVGQAVDSKIIFFNPSQDIGEVK